LASRRSHLTLVGLLLAALVGVALLGWPGSPFHKDLRQGLDLQGGLEVVLEAKPPPNFELTEADLDRAVEIMRKRVDILGVAEPEIRKQGSNQIVIQLPAVHDADQAAAIIGKTAQLELYDLETSLVPPSVDAAQNPVASPNLYDLLQRVKSREDAKPSAYYLFRTKGKKLIAGPEDTRQRLLRTRGNKVPKGMEILTVPGKMTVVVCNDTTSVVCPDSGGAFQPPPKVSFYYLFEHDPDNANDPVPQMTGKHLKLDGTRQDFDPTSGLPVVTMQFTDAGGDLFHEITRDEAIRGRALGRPQHFAIVLDNELRSFPQIDYQKYADGINPGAGGGAEITGLENLSEAKNLATVLQTGALPVEFITVERTDVSATLGKDSLRQARNAAIAGLLLVVIFLLLIYRFLGVVAVLGLGVYAAFMYGALLIFGVTLTLPGFAGLILTIGVAADANIIVFERIKEEVRSGTSVRAGIAAGYAKGFHTILDANAVTCITALVLFAVASAGVKGFALMLLIGTVISLITAVAATRAMLGLLAGFRWFDNPKFMGATASQIPRWQQIDVIGRRRLWFILSLVAIGASVLAVATKGLNLGIDFKGGVQITFTTPEPVPLGQVRAQAAAIGHGDAVVQGRGAVVGDDQYKSFQVRLKELVPAEQERLTNSLVARVQAEKLGVKNVSSSFSRQILQGAIVAIVVSFALIALFVTIRYRWRFAVPILRTLLNDVLITMGIYSISGREVSAATVAAILTILGFSIYDTIIVFDRIRENMKLMPRASIARIANVSIWEVLRRSIFTSFITLLPILALFTFGGDTLKDFAFAIMIGILIGAVSTIFIATPLLTILMERDPEFARRKDAPDDDGKAGMSLRRAERAAAAQPTPATPIDAIEDVIEAVVDAGNGGDGDREAKREKRRQRRKTRPHGRAR
jgi:SecD/SecF fusion protein